MRARGIEPHGRTRPRARRARHSGLAFLLLLLLAASAIAASRAEPPAQAREKGEAVALFRDLVVPADEVRRGDVVCIGCNVRVEGRVTGDIVVIMGSLDLEGRAGRSVVCVLSDVRLGSEAEIEEDFVSILGQLDDTGAEIGGDRVHIPGFFWFPSARSALGVLGSFLAWRRLIGIAVTFLLLLIVVAFVPERVEAMSEAVPARWPMAFLVGLLAYVALFFLYCILLVSVVGIPVAALLHWIVLPVFLALGMAGLFRYLGRRMGAAFGRELSPLAAVLLGFVPFAVLLLLPWFLGGLTGFALGLLLGLLFALVIKVPALGLLLLTRAGGRQGGALPAPPAPSGSTRT